ncbi:MAG: hypothetical protein ACI4PB_05025 [Oscillospiraceae bacterium]
MFKPSGKGQKKAFCINEECSEFVPEEKRGYKKKTAAKSDDKKPAAKKKTSTKKAKE